ncbi:MAG: DUF4240 domain-containing protein [Candidatus Obscuribacterales bacterium]|nr:DUF4240 domain-containing protein [Candidatus Obscuribacterales bacterium]
MQVYMFVTTHYTMGASIFDVLAFILNQNAPNFGSAVEELKLHPHFDDLENFVPGGDQVFQDYKKRLASLPSIKFSRVNKTLTLKYQSKICMGAELYGNPMQRLFDPQIENKHFFEIENESSLLKAFCLELAQTLPVLQKTLKPKDDFDLPGFMAWTAGRVEVLPKENQEVSELLSRIYLPAEEVFDAPKRSYLNSMKLDEFWAAIDLVDANALAEEDEESAVQPVIKHLKRLSADKIKSFHNHMSNALYALDTEEHYKAATQPHSDDGFLYLRCYVLAMGRNCYHEVLANPSQMPKDFSSCEYLLNVAAEAWAEVTKDDPLNFDSQFAEKSYETGSNAAAWT